MEGIEILLRNVDYELRHGKEVTHIPDVVLLKIAKDSIDFFHK